MKQQIFIANREYNVPHEYCHSMVFENGDNRKAIVIGEIPAIKEKMIIGMYVPLQSSEYERTNNEGLPLLNRAAMGTAHILLKSNHGDQVVDAPLEHFGFDIDKHLPGHYKQIISPGGEHTFDLKQSKVYVDLSKIPTGSTDGEAIELCFIYLDPEACGSVQICK